MLRLPHDLPLILYHDLDDLTTRHALTHSFPHAYQKRFARQDERAEAILTTLREHIKAEPNALQRVWARQYASNESFSLAAPPGFGKSTFLTILPAAETKRRFLFILPTRSLTQQQYERARAWYTAVSNQTHTLEEVRMARVAFITTAYYHKHARELGRWDVISIDDADSLIKKARHAEKILRNLTREGQILIASATLPRTLTHAFLAKNFQPAGLSQPVRDIDEYHLDHALTTEDDLFQPSILEHIKHLHALLAKHNLGMFILLSPLTATRETLTRFHAWLNENGLESILSTRFHAERDRFAETRLAIGLAHPHNPLVRGIDLPDQLALVLFLHTPGRSMRLDTLTPSLVRTYQHHLLKTPLARITLHYLATGEISDDNAKRILTTIHTLPVPRGFIKENDRLIIPDIRTYLQASGRTSRLTPRGITHGISIILTPRAYAEALAHRAEQYGQPISLTPYQEEALHKSIQNALKSRTEKGSSITLETRFILVESPAKARRIASFTGRPGMRVKPGLIIYDTFHGTRMLSIAATIGHITDLDEHCYDGVCLHKDTLIPHYHAKLSNETDKTETIRSIQEVAWQHQHLTATSDPDREGEKIALDTTLLTSPWLRNAERMELHMITRKEFERQTTRTRMLNANRIKAQLVRRILDRWVGFQLSRYVQYRLKRKTLSAGRVQTPVLAWILHREDERKERVCRITLKLPTTTLTFTHPLPCPTLPAEGNITITPRETRRETIHPKPPYTTPHLLEDASTRFALSSTETMRILQDLYEHGFITYPRTDSTYVSDEAISIAKRMLEEKHLPFHPRHWGEPGAHEAIRPAQALWPEELLTAAEARGIGLTEQHERVYTLITTRFLASQMPPAEAEQSSLTIQIENITFTHEGITRIITPGFTSIIPVPTIPTGKQQARISTRVTPKAKPYTDAELVKRMREEGIGRPSTYAHIIHTLEKRGYVKRKGPYLIPTRLARTVLTILKDHPNAHAITVEATRKLETIMDLIEEGKEDWHALLLHELTTWYPHGTPREKRRTPPDTPQHTP